MKTGIVLGLLILSTLLFKTQIRAYLIIEAPPVFQQEIIISSTSFDEPIVQQQPEQIVVIENTLQQTSSSFTIQLIAKQKKFPKMPQVYNLLEIDYKIESLMKELYNFNRTTVLQLKQTRIPKSAPFTEREKQDFYIMTDLLLNKINFIDPYVKKLLRYNETNMVTALIKDIENDVNYCKKLLLEKRHRYFRYVDELND